MHEYLMEVRHYFSGYEPFKIEAEDKANALAKAREYVDKNPHYWGGNYDKRTIRCVKKLKQKGKTL